MPTSSQVLIRYKEDPRIGLFSQRVHHAGFPTIQAVQVNDVYTIYSELIPSEIQQTAGLLYNPVAQEAVIDQPLSPAPFDWCIEIGFLPGVTDNEGQTAEESIRDSLGKENMALRVFYSQQLFLKGNISLEQINQLAESFYNPVIQRAHAKNNPTYLQEKGMNKLIPLVKISQKQKADIVDLNIPDAQLTEMGKKGIMDIDANGKSVSRGPLALDLDSMKVIQNYYLEKNRNPTDVELESLAQTWSEHCKHTIFAAALGNKESGYVEEGLYKHYIKRATHEIRAKKGKDDFCVSVFVDNSGGIRFDEQWIVTDKVETHNSPSALDPFGGAITGIVGVNRDAIGFGMGAKPIANRFGFCFANPHDDSPLYRGKGKQSKMLLPRRIMDGVIAGVNSGGNCSGIPTPQGFAIFDARFKGKPLVFVGTLGLIPQKINGNNSWEKKAEAGDYIVMVGGRVGLDGVHGATFSSEAMDAGSPATAVQLGDPITQKKLSDAIVKEARDRELYHSITDNGAGGLSCSVAEMARESNGCEVELEKVPVKYAGMSPWQIWISESQERMTLSVPPEKLDAFQQLMHERGVESTVIGKFTATGKCVVSFHGENVMEIELEFLHEGLPAKRMETTPKKNTFQEPILETRENYSLELLEMLSRLNICSKEFINMQFDHEVQGNSVIKPLQGKGRVQGNFSVIKPILSSSKGIGLGQGIFSGYSDISTYWMAAAGIDLAVRQAICAGSNAQKIALLDNFCWCSSTETEKLWELELAARACYDFSTVYQAPFISGKDSMFNDFKGFTAQDEPIKISVPPTLLISSIGIVENIEKCISMDLKTEGDLIYLLGETCDEMGASEYYRYLAEKNNSNAIGNAIPKIQNPQKNWELYQRVAVAIEKQLLASVYPLEYGGIGVGLAKKAIAGKKGMEIDLSSISLPTHAALFSESLGRIVVSVSPARKEEFETHFGNTAQFIGKVSGETLHIMQTGKSIVNAPITSLETAYKKPMEGF